MRERSTRAKPLAEPLDESQQLMEKKKRLGFALAAYAVLGLLIWTTMSDIPIKVAGGQISIRGLTLAIVAFFAVRTLLHWRSGQTGSREEDQEFDN